MSDPVSKTTKPCPMPDDVCADCGYRCGEATPVETEDGDYHQYIWGAEDAE